MMTSAGKSKVTSRPQDNNDGSIIRMGYLKKLKKMKKRYFVLKKKNGAQKACLDYYDNEKKFKNGQPPKRSIELEACININKKVDLKQRFVIALFTREDCLYLVFDNEDDIDSWFRPMLCLQQENSLLPDQEPLPYYDHVWGVQIKPKGLGTTKSLVGHFRLCLGHGVVSLIKVTPEKPETIDFPLSAIRNCGHNESSFYMSVGRLAITGEGEFWMHTDDNNIAQSMHETIIEAMKMNKKEDLAPHTRTRSSSANESAKPILLTSKRVSCGGTSSSNSRDRCDSMPGRPRTISEGHHNPHPHKKITPIATSDSRPHSMYTRAFSSSPAASGPMSPGSTDSAGSSLSLDSDNGQDYLRRFGHSSTFECIHAEPAILEENPDEYLAMGFGTDYGLKPSDENSSYVPMNTSITASKLKLSSDNSPATSPKDGIVSPPHVGSYEGYTRSSWSLQNNALESSTLSKSTGEYIHPKYIPNYPHNVMSSHSWSMSTPVDVPHPYMEMGGDLYPTKSLSKAGSSIISDDSYLDMEPSPSSRGSSLTSRTPSTDLKFGEFQLDKVTSYWGPSEDDVTIAQDRPLRAHSFGSKCEHVKKRQKHVNGENLLPDFIRTRAHSIGSHPRTKRAIGTVGSNLYFPFSLSSDLSPQDEEPSVSHSTSVGCPNQLSSSWSGSACFSQTGLPSKPPLQSDLPTEDFVEITFPSKNVKRHKNPMASVASSRSSVCSAGERTEFHASPDYMVMNPDNMITPQGNNSTESYMEMSFNDSRKLSLHRLPDVPECSATSLASGKPSHDQDRSQNSYLSMNFNKTSDPVPLSQQSTNPISERTVEAPVMNSISSAINRQFKELNLSCPSDSPYLNMDLKSPSTSDQVGVLNREDYMEMNPATEITSPVSSANNYLKSLMKICSVKVNDSFNLKASDKSTKNLVPEHRRTRSDDYVSMNLQNAPRKPKEIGIKSPCIIDKEKKSSPKWELPSPDSSKITGSLDRSFGQSKRSVLNPLRSVLQEGKGVKKKSDYMNLDFNITHRVSTNLFSPSVSHELTKNEEKPVNQLSSNCKAEECLPIMNFLGGDNKAYRNPEKCPIDATSGTMKVTKFEAVQNERITSSISNDVMDKGVRKTANKILNSKLSEELSKATPPLLPDEENYGIVDLSGSKDLDRCVPNEPVISNINAKPDLTSRLSFDWKKCKANLPEADKCCSLVNSNKTATPSLSNNSSNVIMMQSKTFMPKNREPTCSANNGIKSPICKKATMSTLTSNIGAIPSCASKDNVSPAVTNNGVFRSNSERLSHAPVIQKQLSVPDSKLVSIGNMDDCSAKLSAAIRQRSLSGNNVPMTPAPRKISSYVASNSTPSLKNSPTSKLPFSFRNSRNKDMIPVEIGEDVLRNTLTSVKTPPLPLVQLTEENHDQLPGDCLPPLLAQELNYASLDLGPPDNEDYKTRSCNGSSDSQEESPKLHYAEIDFTKSEGLRTTSLAREYSHRAKYS